MFVDEGDTYTAYPTFDDQIGIATLDGETPADEDDYTVPSTGLKQIVDGITYGSTTLYQKVYSTVFIDHIADVEKSPDDEKQTGTTSYKGFESIGVQKRLAFKEGSTQKYGEGLRFVTVLSDALLSTLGAFNSSDVSYGYVVAAKDKFQAANGNKTIRLGMSTTTDIDCTSNGSTKLDHQYFTDNGYRMFTFVIDYDGATEEQMATEVIARPYVKFTDTDGRERVHYFTYGSNGGTSVNRGCSASFKSVAYQWETIEKQ